MTKQELEQKLALLEAERLQLLTEIRDLDNLMLLVGFKGGLQGLKSTAQTLNQRHIHSDPFSP